MNPSPLLPFLSRVKYMRVGEDSLPLSTVLWYMRVGEGEGTSPTRMYLTRERKGRGGEGFIYNFQHIEFKTNEYLLLASK